MLLNVKKIIVVIFAFQLINMESFTQSTASAKMHEKVLYEVETNGKLKIVPSATSSKNDFDFLIGSHYVRHRKLKSRLNNSQEWIESEGTQEMNVVLNGLGDVDRYYMLNTDGTPFEGVALRFFNPETRLWSLYWADSRFGALDPVPVVGSFENNIGHFFAKDKLDGKDILIQFQWDRADPDKPVWKQAFSSDNGKTWEWNWYMFFSKTKDGSNKSSSLRESTANDKLAANKAISVLELRNYLTKEGQRDKFIDYFENNFTDAQSAKGGYILGLSRVKDADNNFLWMRGYQDMAARSKYLPEFYYSDYWKQRRNKANDMLVNNDNVYLLKPLNFSDVPKNTVVNSNEFGKSKRLIVVDYYFANTKLKELIAFFKDKYAPFLKNNGTENITYWISELQENDFPALPVYQDKNLLVTITSYHSENEYNNKMRELFAEKNQQVNNELKEIMTTKSTLILYPTSKSFTIDQK